jgi:hypothetical protein
MIIASTKLEELLQPCNTVRSRREGRTTKVSSRRLEGANFFVPESESIRGAQIGLPNFVDSVIININSEAIRTGKELTH